MTDRRNGISEFIACEEIIVEMLKKGHTKAHIFDTLQSKGLISFNYHNFCYHCRSKINKGEETAQKQIPENSADFEEVKPKSENSAAFEGVKPKSKKKGFNFNSKPSVDDLA